MSHSKKVLSEFGAISVAGAITSASLTITDKNLSIGSTSALAPKITPAPSGLSDAATTVTVAQLRTGILTMTPTAARTITLPTAANMAAVLTSVGDTLDFSVINLGADTYALTIATPSTSLVGAALVKDSTTSTDATPGSGMFRVRMTNITSGTEAYSTYRLA